MDLIVLDTETTGLDAKAGHRVIELGCVRIRNRRHTSENFHSYLNPDRDIDVGAQEVHGISSEFLEDKPRFADVVDSFIEFIAGSELVIHNAAFDVEFLNQELELLGDSRRVDELCRVTDSLALAREMHPGQRNSLDALCRRYGVDNSGRQLHGALLDAEILADVYLAMTGGQTSLGLESQTTSTAQSNRDANQNARGEGQFPVIYATSEECAEHQRWLDLLGDDNPWRRSG
ncbi:MAG: DNA polymerase III subunit epsilon [Gammaproteobacteria bacterium]